MEVYRPGDPGFTYPPGYPILFSLVSLVASPLASLGHIQGLDRSFFLS